MKKDLNIVMNRRTCLSLKRWSAFGKVYLPHGEGEEEEKLGKAEDSVKLYVFHLNDSKMD